MGYLQVLNLMVKAYKAARGVMPKGLDLLKLKMKARQKVIDSKKVIQFPKDKITDPFKPRPEGIQTLIKKGDVKIGKAPKTKTKDYKRIVELEEENMLADQAKAKEFAEFANRIKGMSSTNRVAERLKDLKGVDLSKLSGVEAQNIASEVIGRKGPFKTISSKGAKEVLGKLESIIKKANVKDFAQGGLANISQTYDNNPTLQSQFPNKQDYLDLFSSTTTTTTTPQTQTYTQMTQQAPAGIPAVKPIVPIIPPQGDGDDSGGGITAPTGYGYRGPSMTIDDIEEGTITPEEERFAQGQALRGLAEKTLLGSLFFKAKDAVSDKAKDIADKVRAEEAAKAEALRSLQEAIARNQARASQQDWTGGGDYSGGFDQATQNYDDPYDPGQTE